MKLFTSINYKTKNKCKTTLQHNAITLVRPGFNMNINYKLFQDFVNAYNKQNVKRLV